jgi:hypothetical protein
MKVLLLCLVFLILVFADIDLSKEQILYQIGQNSYTCSQRGLNGEDGGTVTSFPVGSGIELVGKGSLGDKSVSCSSLTLGQYKEIGPESFGELAGNLTSYLNSTENRVYFYNCTVSGTTYPSMIISSNYGTALYVNNCRINLSTTKKVSISSFEISGQTTLKNNCSSMEIEGQFTAANFNSIQSDDTELASASVTIEKGVQGNSTIANATFSCSVVYSGAFVVLFDCLGVEQNSTQVEMEGVIAYLVFDDQTILVQDSNGNDTMCWHTLGQTVLRISLAFGIFAALFGLLFN